MVRRAHLSRGIVLKKVQCGGKHERGEYSSVAD